MGLSVSQVRLLALTSRKADIELQMQVDSKRKQMLTRQSTELSTQYYQRLQDSNIMYATSNGYEDVTYGYLMGDTVNGHITDEFYEQIITGADNNIASKAEYNMILINKFGQVVVDSDVAKAIVKAKSAVPTGTVYDQTAEAIKQLLDTNNSQTQLSAISLALKKLDNTKASHYADKYLASSTDVIKAMIKNGGFQSGGTLYVSKLAGDNNYYRSSAIAEKVAKEGLSAVSSADIVHPQDGYCYMVEDYNCSQMDGGYSKVFMNGKAQDMTMANAKYLGSIVSYFAPILSAGLQNGISCAYETSEKALRTSSSGQTFNVSRYSGATYKNIRSDSEGKLLSWNGNPNTAPTGVNSDGTTVLTAGDDHKRAGTFDANVAQFTNDKVSYAIDYLSCNQPVGTMIMVQDNNGKVAYFKKNDDKDNGDGTFTLNIEQITAEEYNSRQEISIGKNTSYDNARDNKKLQAGFKSGEFQLAMVDDTTRGSYKKNTFLNYFTNLNYVVEKTDSSKREELTAWFNAEQNAISEKETYWDAEIQNLSTELTSVNTEIDSVKTLKSNAIKSVFDWGGS